MRKYVTVSTKIPQELKEKMRQLDIRASKLLRKAIEDEIRRREVQKIKESIEKLKPILNRVSMREIVESIREDREHR